MLHGNNTANVYIDLLWDTGKLSSFKETPLIFILRGIGKSLRTYQNFTGFQVRYRDYL